MHRLVLRDRTWSQPDCPYGDCNRLRRLPSAPATDTGIPPQESRALFVDFTFDSLDQAPKAVLHHLYGTGAINPGSTAPAPVDYLAAPLDIAAGTPRVIGPPVKGDHWVALNGCCLPGFPHRTSLATFNGKLVNGQRFAIDWKQANENGEFYTGDRTKNESYVDYGAPIYAVADGTITTTLDDARPEPAGRPARRRPRARPEDHGRDRRRQPHRRRTSAAAPTRSTPTCRRARCWSSRATRSPRAR